MNLKDEYLDNSLERIQSNIADELAKGVKLTQGSKDLVEDKFYSGSLEIMIENYLPEGMTLNSTEIKTISNGMKALSTGVRAAIPINCYGPKCPFIKQCPFAKIDKLPLGKPCQPPGQMVATAQHGEVPIEELDSKVHTLISYDRKRDGIKGGHRDRMGQSFTKHERPFKGQLVHLHTEHGKDHKVTPDHISIARFNENALGKFCVYIMKKGDFLRIGKSQLLKESTDGKLYMPVKSRMVEEDADAMWILGVYKTNTDALLAEEFYSCRLQLPRALFLATEKEDTKYNGLYRWVTQAQLDQHHRQFIHPPCSWGPIFETLGLSFDHPFLEKNNSDRSYEEIKVYARRSMQIRACNLLEEVMDVPTLPTEHRILELEPKKCRRVEWERLRKITAEDYEGLVYSLDVERHKTYFSQGIATHNCPVETMLMDLFTKRYLNEFEVHSDDMSEVSLMSMLAATHIIEMRAFVTLGKETDKDEGNPIGLIKNTVGYNNDDQPIIQMQEHPAYLQLERAWRWRKNILESMVGTRKEKYRKDAALKEKSGASPSFTAADLKSKIDKMTIIDITED